jgi:hypothetical protein
MLDSKGEDRIVPFLIHRRWEEPEVKNIPEIPDILKNNKDDLSMYKAWAGSYEFQRPFSVAPEVPKERLQLLRKAFADTLKDEVFMAEAKKSKFAVTHTPGEEIEKHVDDILDMTPKAKEGLMFLVRKAKS